jgi:trigger factor
LALIEGCRHSLEVTVPAEEVERETEKVVQALREKVHLPGFRPGKVPASIIRSRFPGEVRQGVLEALIPKYLRQEVEKANLPLVGEPDIRDLHFEPGQPLRFRAEFEVVPEFELQEYRGITVAYSEPEITEEDIDERLERLRDQKADYVNVDPRPVADGDFAVVRLESIAGVEGKPIRQEEMMLHVGDPDTLADFTENLRGMQPGEEKEFDVTYPEDYGEERLAGRTVRFRVFLKAIRRKELPELNDEFARDLGDYQNLAELREAVRTWIRTERELVAQQKAKNELIDKLVDMHDFPVPEVFVERQMEANVEQRVRELVAHGVDPRNIKLDWDKVRAAQGERARRDVKASMILEKIADREAIETTMDELDREIQRIARQQREPVPAVRKRLEQEGQLRRIASRIRIEKTVNFLFEQARKVPAD